MPVDVVVPVFRDVGLTGECLRSVLELSAPALLRLIVVNDASPEPEMAALLEGLRRADPRVRLLTNSKNAGFVASANLGLAVSEADVVLLNSDTRVTPGWLEELVDTLAENPSFAALSPLSNNATLCSVPDFGLASPLGLLADRALPLRGLPRVSEMPTLNGFCVLFRRAALDQLGLFDRKYGRGYNEENDWCQRARAARWRVGRANRAVVLHHGEVSFAGARARLDVLNGRRLVARYPRYIEENAQFESGPHARLAARAVRCALRRLQVAVPSTGPGAEVRARAITGHFGPRSGNPDVTCLRGIGASESRGILLTLLDAGTSLTSAELPAQLARSELVVTETPAQKAQIEQFFELPPKRVVVAPLGDHAAFLSLVERAVLEPTLLAEGGQGAP